MSKQSLTVFGNEGLFEYILFLHQWCAGVPCLANLFPNGIVAVVELVKHESVQFGDIYLVLFIQHGLVCQYANDLTDDMMTVDLHLVLDDLTLQRQRELLYDIILAYIRKSESTVNKDRYYSKRKCNHVLHGELYQRRKLC